MSCGFVTCGPNEALVVSGNQARNIVIQLLFTLFRLYNNLIVCDKGKKWKDFI